MCRKVRDLHKYDCLRANKSTMAWGVEARVPFLDRQAQKIFIVGQSKSTFLDPFPQTPFLCEAD